MAIVIEKRIPVPTGRGTIVEAAKQMEVGDSFLHDKGSVGTYLKQSTGYKFMVRRVGDKFRYWRTA